MQKKNVYNKLSRDVFWAWHASKSTGICDIKVGSFLVLSLSVNRICARAPCAVRTWNVCNRSAQPYYPVVLGTVRLNTFENKIRYDPNIYDINENKVSAFCKCTQSFRKNAQVPWELYDNNNHRKKNKLLHTG